jgi:hypothetical protein
MDKDTRHEHRLACYRLAAGAAPRYLHQLRSRLNLRQQPSGPTRVASYVLLVESKESRKRENVADKGR